jgi:hypothetical protein
MHARSFAHRGDGAIGDHVAQGLAGAADVPRRLIHGEQAGLLALVQPRQDTLGNGVSQCIQPSISGALSAHIVTAFGNPALRKNLVPRRRLPLAELARLIIRRPPLGPGCACCSNRVGQGIIAASASPADTAPSRQNHIGLRGVH